MTDNHPNDLILDQAMGRSQILVVALCVLLNALDGFDVLSISFASPGIAREWHVDRAALGVVLSMELIGMTVGSIAIGALCDRIGRRAGILASLALMALGMAAAAAAGDVQTLSAGRLVAGVGIGGMLAVTNAATAEHSSARRRDLAVTVMAAGYPVGAIVGGALVSHYLLDHGWRSVFAAGAVATLACIPLVWFGLPETIAWLERRRPAHALERINVTLSRFGRPPVAQLPPNAVGQRAASFVALVSPAAARITALLALAYLAHIMTFYFILKWTPKIVSDMGFAASAAGGVLVWANVGGLAGAGLLALLTPRIDVRRLTIGAMLVSVGLVAVFGRSAADLRDLSASAAAAGFFTNAGVVGLYAIIARAFPADLRGRGTGLVIGIGRGGAALSPIVAGLLFAHGRSLPTVALLMGLGSLVAAIALLFVPAPE